MTTIIKGFFFDLDGTLVDTHESNYLAYRNATEDVKGIRLGVELKQKIKAGESSAAFLPSLIPNITSNEVDEINRRKKQYYPAQLKASNLNNYLSTFLRQMSGHYVTALVTTAKKENALAVLKEHSILGYFNFTIFGDDVSKMKPDPEAYLLALKTADLKPSEVIAFEDSQKGIDSAIGAGIAVIHVKDFV